MNCLGVFDQFAGLAVKGLISVKQLKKQKIYLIASAYTPICMEYLY